MKRVLSGVGQVLADRIWDIRKQGNITLEGLRTIPRLKITPEMLDCVEFWSAVHVDHGCAKQLPIDAMYDYLAEYVLGSSAQNYESLENLHKMGSTHMEKSSTNSIQPLVFLVKRRH